MNAILRMPLALLHSPLIRNGYALVASAGLTSMLGLVYWILAARIYSPEELGLGAALISTLLTLGNVAQLNFGNLLNRFLPVAGRFSGRLIMIAYGCGCVAALVISLAAMTLIEHYFQALDKLFDTPFATVGFVAATVAWTIFALQDSVLAGLRKGTVVPIENAVYSIAKIGLLFVFAGTATLGSGVFAAWIVPLPAIVLVVNLVIFLRILPRHQATDGPAGDDIGIFAVARFFGWDYVGTLATMAAMGLAPLLVLRESGASALAAYHLAWTMAYTLYLIGRSMGVSLLTEASSDRSRMLALVADALVHTMIPLIFAVLAIIVAAPWIMGLFGPSYALIGTPLLRILALSCLPWGAVTIYLSYMRAAGRLWVVAAAQIVTLLIVIGLGLPLLRRYGAVGMGYSWLIANSLVFIGIAAFAIWRDPANFVLATVMHIASAVMRMFALMRRRQGLPPELLNTAYPNRDLVIGTGDPAAPQWIPLGVAESYSDVRTILLGTASHPLTGAAEGMGHRFEALLKVPMSATGAASLERHLDRVQRLRTNPDIAAFNIELPEILAVQRDAMGLRVVERAIQGVDGRVAVARLDKSRPQALRAAVIAMASLHRATQITITIGEDWLDRWIDRPARQLQLPVHTLMTKRQRKAAIEAFIAEQRRFWSGRSLQLGCSHGDFSLGNILYARSGPDVGRPELDVQVRGIIDWDRSTWDAPGSLDACHLALTSASHFQGEELGMCVRRMLLSPQWEQAELEWLMASTGADGDTGGWPHDPRAVRAVVGLVWLHHITAVTEKSGRYAQNRYWVAANIELVLRNYLPTMTA
ncbi:MAG: phosphotransferase [Rhizobiales bacterium]|nr:phosphotransferase [Hyphomicrobiales bacterium]